MLILMQTRALLKKTGAAAASSPPDSGVCTKIDTMENGEQRSLQVGQPVKRIQRIQLPATPRADQLLITVCLTGRRKKSLGLYGSEEEAAQAYDRAALSLRSVAQAAHHFQILMLLLHFIVP